jgi:hypothetical protein
VTPIIWLASYPKSGNTWARALFANLTSTGDVPFDINALSRRHGIAASRALFEDYTLLDSGLLTDGEADRLRPAAYRAWAADLARRLDGPVVVKCHDAYTRLEDGTPLLGGAAAARGAIVIVRDPRDVVLSLADHRGTSLDEAISLMCDPSRVVASSGRGQLQQLSQRVLDWSGHISSWLDQEDIAVHLVRYEEMEADAAASLLRAARFAGFEVTSAQAERAAKLSAFNLLRDQERASGFAEGKRDRPFFRRGHSGGWRAALSAAQVQRVENAHGKMMARLGYGAEADPG